MSDSNIRELERQIAQSPTDPVARFNYGLVLLRTGRRDEARSEFALALDAIPKDSQMSGTIVDLIPSLSYRALTWEPRAPCDPKYSNRFKLMLDYNSSLTRLQNAGYLRHPRPVETLSLIIDGILGRINNSKLQRAYADILRDGEAGEWTSLAFERQKKLLFAHQDPLGLSYLHKDRYGPSLYVKYPANFESTKTKEAFMGRKKSAKPRPINSFSDDFVEFLFGYSSKDLPALMTAKTSESYLVIPEDGKTNPVTHQCRIFNTSSNYTHYLDIPKHAASRGVR